MDPTAGFDDELASMSDVERVRKFFKEGFGDTFEDIFSWVGEGRANRTKMRHFLSSVDSFLETYHTGRLLGTQSWNQILRNTMTISARLEKYLKTMMGLYHRLLEINTDARLPEVINTLVSLVVVERNIKKVVKRRFVTAVIGAVIAKYAGYILNDMALLQETLLRIAELRIVLSRPAERPPTRFSASEPIGEAYGEYDDDEGAGYQGIEVEDLYSDAGDSLEALEHEEHEDFEEVKASGDALVDEWLE
jgi:hypothetical protein